MFNALTSQAEARLQTALTEIKTLEQVTLPIEQILHAGTYVRTMYLPAGVVMGSALIKIPTVLIVSGHALVNNGAQTFDIEGYKVFQATAPRRAVWRGITDTYVSMIFATQATSVEAAEKEFTDEWRLLQTAKEHV